MYAFPFNSEDGTFDYGGKQKVRRSSRGSERVSLLKKKFLLRINPELWEEIYRWAEEDFRSVNGQIEYLLKQAVNQRRKGTRKENPTKRE